MKKQDSIVIRGLNQNNLKHVSLTIPKDKIVVFTGVSGSGKSSIVFDTIAAESNSSASLRNENFPLKPVSDKEVQIGLLPGCKQDLGKKELRFH